MEKHGQTVVYRTINSVVKGDELIPDNFEKQKDTIAEMKYMAKGITIHCMLVNHLLL